MTPDPVRLQILVLARAATSAKPMAAAAIAKDLERFAPEPGPQWKAAIEAAIHELIAQKVLSERRQVLDEDALGKRLGTSTKVKWPQLTDRLLPALGLGMPPKESFTTGVLKGRDEWAAAIVGRALQLWTSGRPLKVSALCNQLVWQRLGLPGKAKALPDEVRGWFLQRELGTSAAPTDRLLRLLAARELSVQPTDLKALRNALVQRWLTRRVLGGNEAPASSGPDASGLAALAPLRTSEPSFLDDLRRATASVGEAGCFGDRKVFIAAAWDELRRQPARKELSLDDFKTRLLDAHRGGTVALARADLMGAMDPQLAARSETISPIGATFHFIIREEA
jgi:hypothetical protein